MFERPSQRPDKKNERQHASAACGEPYSRGLLTMPLRQGQRRLAMMVGTLALSALLLACTNASPAATPTTTSLPTKPVREYALPTAGSTPADIVQGLDGALWFTEPGANSIGRM